MRRAWAVAASGVLLTLVALTFDASPLFVPGIALTALGLLTPAWIWAAAGAITVTRTVSADRVVEGEPVEATIEIRRGLIRPPAIEVVDPLAGETAWQSGSLSLRSGDRSARFGLVERFPRRGRRELGPPSVIVSDPLELARARRTGRVAVEVLVLPRTEPVKWLARDLGSTFERAGGRLPADPLAAGELDGLRPYRIGTPASRIHWAALARGAGLLERRLKADADARPLVVLDARCGDPDSGALDAAVRAAASLTLELARRGGCGLLLPGERRPLEIEPELRAWPAAHARLALLEGGTASRAPRLAQTARPGRVFYVAAEPPQRLPAALLQGSRLAAVLVIPGAQGTLHRSKLTFEVAGCRGYVVGAARRAQTLTRVS